MAIQLGMRCPASGDGWFRTPQVMKGKGRERSDQPTAEPCPTFESGHNASSDEMQDRWTGGDVLKGAADGPRVGTAASA